MATAYKCRSCGKEGKENFYSSAKYQCKPCWNKRTASAGKAQVKILKDEFGGKCSVCGYNKCFDALQFHHVDPSKKEFALGEKRGLSIDKLREELSKCILVCSNCHIEIHSKLKLS
jgi:hypothetical protein